MIVLLIAASASVVVILAPFPPFGLGLEVAERLIQKRSNSSGRPQAVQVDAVARRVSFRPLADEACVLSARRSGRGRSADGKLARQLSYSHRTPGEPLEDRSPSRVAEGVHRYCVSFHLP